MNSFEVVAPRRIVFGRGRAIELAGFLDAADRVLFVTGRSDRFRDLMGSVLVSVEHLEQVRVDGEPTVDDCQTAVEAARRARCTKVVAMGGGSAIDLGKAVASLATSNGSVFDHLEVVGRGVPMPRTKLPFAALPTTAGTGAEATKNAVLTARGAAGPVKVSLRSDTMVPDLAIVDPTLTHSVPRDTTLHTGLDALTQVIEPWLSHAATPFSDALTAQAIPLALPALEAALANGDDADARELLSRVSLYGGLALANAKLGAVHGLAGPLGGILGAPHGALCARLLPFVLEANLSVVDAPAEFCARARRLAVWLTGDLAALPGDAVVVLRSFVERHAVPGLGAMGLTQSAHGSIVQSAQQASSMKGNPVRLSVEALHRVLEAAA